ncbi:MAG: hypothetical protein HKO59_06965 [Phycisphaerales bacterium]|nr:hypothetical protein [Phycisphaerales bacterium]NNM25716.1 hypothetical protein [Phycisphaerales bacterium]
MKICAPRIIAALVVAVTASPALAGVVDIGGGWQAEWDASLDPFVDVVSNGVVGDAVFIQKAAEFTQGPVGGIYPSIPIVFRQIAPGAVSNIVIDDEIIVNSTRSDWSGFDMTLLDGGDVAFDPAATAGSGGGGPIGFSIAPFTTAEFNDDLTRLSIGGGTLSDTGVWFPGNGADDGQLWINVNPTGNTIFTLKETPVPAPGVVGLLVAGGLIRRRRRG